MGPPTEPQVAVAAVNHVGLADVLLAFGLCGGVLFGVVSAAMYIMEKDSGG